MRNGLSIVLALVAAAVLAASFGVGGRTPAAEARAAAAPCVLPQVRPLWVDFGHPVVAEVFARPGLVLGVSSGDFPATMRKAGARTMYWDMNLNNRVGLPTAPAAADTIVDKANRLFDFASGQMDCTTPTIILNELFGAGLETPWSASNTQYRDNVLTFMRTIAARGGRPMLLIPGLPFTGNGAADWWREVAKVGDIVPEVYFRGPTLHKLGPLLASRRMRVAMRRSVRSLTEIGIPPSKLGVVLGFQTSRGSGGREGLQPASAWFRVAKWQALAARQVASETGIGTIISWGWGTYRADDTDTDKTATACVYLWTRDPRLCDGPKAAGPDFDTSRTEGQIILPSGAQCTVGKRTISRAQIAALTKLTADRDIALSVLLARLAESPHAAVPGARVLAAERAVRAAQFRGSAASYRAALARSGASVSLARGALGDELRRLKLESRISAPRPTAREVSSFYTAYPDLLARRVEVKPAPWWLGRRVRGLALAPVAPKALFALRSGRARRVLDLEAAYRVKPLDETQALGSVPLAVARPAIAAVLAAFERHAAFERWSVTRQEVTLRGTVCLRDDLPEPCTIRLAGYLPFLTTAG